MTKAIPWNIQPHPENPSAKDVILAIQGRSQGPVRFYTDRGQCDVKPLIVQLGGGLRFSGTIGDQHVIVYYDAQGGGSGLITPEKPPEYGAM